MRKYILEKTEIAEDANGRAVVTLFLFTEDGTRFEIAVEGGLPELVQTRRALNEFLGTGKFSWDRCHGHETDPFVDFNDTENK